MYGKVMSLPDTSIVDYFTLVTAAPADEVTAIEESLDEGMLAPMEAKKRLAREVTATLYSNDDALAAEGALRADDPARRDARGDGGACRRGSATLLNALRDAGVVTSGGEARRLVAQGGVAVNGEAVEEITLEVSPGDEIKIGRHRFLRIVEAS